MATIIIKNSSIAGNTPSTLASGELALNIADGRLFYGSSSVVKEFTGSGSSGASSSFATTASYALTASYVIGGGGSTSPGGLNTQVQFNSNNTFSGSHNFTFNSASNTLSLTGSLNISGSTTQIGSNNLFGNTSLSGSIIISGALETNNPTVKIYGDTQHNGYIRFDPVSTNIDSSISASYIYVSGSTEDLYFSQNGSGYNNVTRLRWLEGNLYTGLLHGGLIGSSSSTVYTISSGSGVIVNLNASYNDDPYPTIQYLNWGNLSASIAPLSASFDQQFIAINSGSQIVAQGIPYTDGEYNTLIPIGLVLHQNRSTINGVKTSPSVAYGWKQRSSDFVRAFGPLKISGYTVLPSGSSTGSLTVGNGTAFVDGANYAVDPNSPSYAVDNGTTTSKIFRYYQSASTWVYGTNGGAGYQTLDPVYYNPGGLGVLSTVGASNYSLQRCYWYPNSVTKAITVYYGNDRYGTLAQAVAAIASETFSEAPNTTANAVYLGTFAIKGGTNTTLQNPAHFTWLPGGLFRGVGGGGSGGGSTSPGGSNTQIQYNNNGAFDGVANLTWDGATLSATGSFSGSLLGTASYANNGGVTSITAGTGISINQPTGNVTITSIAASYNTATGSYGSFYDTNTQTNPASNTINSMSINTTDISNGVTISGSTNPYNTYIKTVNAGIYDIQFSAQFDRTTTGTDIVYIWLRKNGTDIPDSNTSIVLTGGAAANPIVAAWNWFVNASANDYFQIMWLSADTNIRMLSTTPTYGPVIPSLIVTANRVDTFLSNTGSFSGSFAGTLTGTASYATTASLALTASFFDGTVTSASYALTASATQLQGGLATSMYPGTYFYPNEPNAITQNINASSGGDSNNIRYYPFVLSQDTKVTGIGKHVRATLSTTTGSYRLGIYASVQGNIAAGPVPLPGALVGDYGVVSFGGTTPAFVEITIAAVSQPTLQKGKLYWLACSPSGSTTTYNGPANATQLNKFMGTAVPGATALSAANVGLRQSSDGGAALPNPAATSSLSLVNSSDFVLAPFLKISGSTLPY
jgi:hypothetical protein